MPGSPPPMPPIWDRGLQPERTLLAWNRTILALLIGATAMGRWFAEQSGYLAGALLLLVLPGALWLLTHLERRRKRVLETLHAGEPLPSGRRLTAALSAVVALLGVAELGHMVLR